MKLIYKITAVLLTALLFCIGCAANKDNVIQIDPNQDVNQTSNKSVTLYFGDATGNYLVKESRKVELSANQTLEEFAINELIKGPRGTEGDKIPLINPSCKLISVNSNEEILTLTLSRNFLDWSFAGVKNDRQQSRIKKLSVYSIVNTLVEATGCPRVQILIESVAGGSGQRLLTDQVGITGGENSILGALSWDGSFVLSPGNTMKVMLSSLQQRDFEMAYTLVAYNDEEIGEKPSLSAFLSIMNLDWVVETFSVSDYAVGADGNTACVIINFTCRSLKNERVYRQSIPVTLVNENNVWKMEYSEFISIFDVQVYS